MVLRLTAHFVERDLRQFGTRRNCTPENPSHGGLVREASNFDCSLGLGIAIYDPNTW